VGIVREVSFGFSATAGEDDSMPPAAVGTPVPAAASRRDG